MEPILPEPTASNRPEALQEHGEQIPSPEAMLRSGETAPNRGPEGTHEQMVQPVQSTPVAMPANQQTQPVQQQPQPVGNQVTASPQADVTNPLIADDVDVIEKEWVDKAKKIVSSTKEDPYVQEKEVSKLQADYLKKRYNKDIKRNE